MSQTIYDKIWNDHLVNEQEDGTCLLFVDRHLIHEVTSPQAFEGLRSSNRKVRQPKLTLAVADHNVPTTDRSKGIEDEDSRIQVETLEKNCNEFGIQLFGMNDKRQGIVHIIGPEQGFTQPGSVIVCGDSHTATHGAFGALAFGIGTSEIEHVLATQTLIQKKSKNFRINVGGKLPIGVTSKDVILQIIGKIGTAGGTGYVIEYAGNLISSLSVEQRMTICNMTIEGGARAGLIQPDEKIFKYLQNKPMSPKNNNWDKALEYWSNLKSDTNANFDKEINIDGLEIKPMVTWGTSPQDVVEIDGKVPNPDNEIEEEGMKRTHASLEEANLVLCVYDITKQEEIGPINKDTITVLNKCDLLSEVPRCGEAEVCVSAETGLGLDNLVELILIKLGLGEETSLLSRRRHVVCLQECLDSLSEAVSLFEQGLGLELVAESLLSAQESLGKITRPMSSDDLLGEIFSEFCIGK